MVYSNVPIREIREISDSDYARIQELQEEFLKLQIESSEIGVALLLSMINPLSLAECQQLASKGYQIKERIQSIKDEIRTITLNSQIIEIPLVRRIEINHY